MYNSAIKIIQNLVLKLVTKFIHKCPQQYDISTNSLLGGILGAFFPKIAGK